MGHDVLLDQAVYVIGGARRDIGKTPGRLELELRNMMVKKLDEDVGQIRVDDRLNWWLVLNRQEFPDTNKAKKLINLFFVEEKLTESVKILQLELHFVRKICRKKLYI